VRNYFLTAGFLAVVDLTAGFLAVVDLTAGFLTVVDLTAGFLVAVDLTAGFLTVVDLTAGFLAVVDLTAGFLAVVDLTAGFLAVVDLTAGFLAVVVLAAGFLAVVDFFFATEDVAFFVAVFALSVTDFVAEVSLSVHDPSFLLVAFFGAVFLTGFFPHFAHFFSSPHPSIPLNRSLSLPTHSLPPSFISSRIFLR